MARDYFYLFKLLVISLIRAILPLYIKFTVPTQLPAPKPTQRLFYASKTSPGKKPLRFYVYKPDVASDKPLPIHLSTQGSGFCLHTFGSDAVFCAWLANAVPCVVIDFETRKGPEDPWPRPIDDVHDAVAHARRIAPQQGWDASRISIGGFSSGGCLALIEAARSGKEGNSLDAVIAFYPSTNLAEGAYQKPGVSVEDAKGAGGDVPRPVRRLFYASYLPGNLHIDRSDPLVSPYYADPHVFPSRVMVVTCTHDSLAREGKAFVDQLEKARPGTVTHFSAESQGHDWDHECKEDTEPARIKWEAYALARDTLREAFGLTQPLST